MVQSTRSERHAVFHFIERLTATKPLISIEDEEWQYACFEWFLKGTGGVGRFRHSVAVLPTDDFFPQKRSRAPELQQAILDQIKIHAGMSQWPCTLAVQDPDPTPFVSPEVYVKNTPQSPAGTFRRVNAEAVITYSPDLVSRPMAFVATIAHELTHFLISEMSEPPPGGAERLEHATDMTAVFLGFGVFLLNSAVNHAHTSTHWSQRWQGYLSEDQLTHALAMSTLLLRCKQEPIARELKGYLRRSYKVGLNQVERSGRLAALRSIAPLQAANREIPLPNLDRSAHVANA